MSDNSTSPIDPHDEGLSSPEPGSRAAAPTTGGGSRRTKVLALLAGLLVLALVGTYVGYRYVNRLADTSSGDIPVWTPTPSATGSPRVQLSAVPPSTPAPVVPAGCLPAAKPITPTKFSIDQMKVSAEVLSLGTDPSGAPEAPPKNASHTVGWWNEGPAVGADKGRAILTIHTYRTGKALGNELNSEKGLKPGMIVRLTDAKGETMCYKYERAVKVWVKDYDPTSTVLFDDTGKPMAVIVICWDFNKGTEEWDSRVLFYLTPLS